MTTKEIEDIKGEINGYLDEQRLHDAFVRLRNVAEAMMLWKIVEETKQLEETYAFMLKYLTEGVADPSREELLGNLVNSLYRLTDEFAVSMMSKETPTLFYNIRRYSSVTDNTLHGIIERYITHIEKAHGLDNLFNSSADETLENDLFNSIWTAFPLSKSDSDDLRRLLSDEYVPTNIIRLILSALTLGALEFFDKEKLDILLEIYSKYSSLDTQDAIDISITSLVGIIFVLLKYRDRKLPLSTVRRFDSIKEQKSWQSDVKTVVLEIIRAKDTERINRTMRDEIIPGMMAMRPEIEKKLKDGDLPLEEFDGMQMNPEWEEMLRKSGISDKLKELNEMQMEGSDVFMSTFSHLKNFPFFTNVSGWFTPFSTGVTAIEKMVEKTPELSDIAVLIETLPFLCDSDKFSMMFSVEMVPDGQRKIMLGQIQAQREQMAEMMTHVSAETLPVKRKKALRNYLQDVYRFYNLFRRKSEFYNIFDFCTDLLRIDLLREEISKPELLNLVAEFYFKRQYWEDALKAFELLDQQNEISSIMYQKMGYCLERAGKIEEAVNAYEQADLLDSSSIWLKTRLAKAYRAVGRLEDAIRTYGSLSKLEPENTTTAMSLGYTLIQAERFDEAIKQFYKVEFLDNDNRKALRPLAWCFFMTGDFSKSQKYYERILLDNPGSEDYLNMGHVALALGQFKEAINFYKLSVIKSDGSADTFFKALEIDRPALTRVGIETNTISLVADAMLYTLHP